MTTAIIIVASLILTSVTTLLGFFAGVAATTLYLDRSRERVDD